MAPTIDPETIVALQSPFGQRVSAWRVDLDAHAVRLNPEILTAAEIRRAERMTQPLDARRFLASRHALRALLASYIACGPEKIRYHQADSGKPAVLGASLEFSLSRSQGYALVACSRHGPVGADIEVLRPIIERESLIESVFAETEKQAIRETVAREKDEIFLRIWVRKEASVKASGLGVAAPLSALVVGTGPARLQVSLQTGQSHWLVEVASLATHDSTVAALAVAQKA